MKISLFLLLTLFHTHAFVFTQSVDVPQKIEEEINSKIRLFENKGTVNYNVIIDDILKFNVSYVEETIFKRLEEIETKKPAILNQIIKILGNLESNRVVLTLIKYTEPEFTIPTNEKPIPRPRHIRIAAVTALLQNPTEERAKAVLKLLNDTDTIFLSLVLKQLKARDIKSSVPIVFDVFKNASVENAFNVKADSASLIIALSDDPQLKNSVLLTMIMDTSVHIRRAGLALLPEGGFAGDSEIRRQIKASLNTAKDEELELTCKAVGLLGIKDAQSDLIHVLDTQKTPLIKWESLYSLFKLEYDKADINKRIQELIEAYKVNPNIKNADQERFERLKSIVNGEKEK